eukprot:GHVR01175765.1.p1 GENE.GHVR01175765.1~~GHVR01175765.1.p1  ORF type:complete len:105 (+),score=27.16 GHVR01175765.1:225-539(+)
MSFLIPKCDTHIHIPTYTHTENLFAYFIWCVFLCVCGQGTLLSCTDADGKVKLWDIRKGVLLTTFDTGNTQANSSVFDLAGRTLFVASSDKQIKVSAPLYKFTL